MGPVNAPRRSLVYVHRYSGLGCAFAAAVMVFMAGGWFLDKWLGSFPVLMVLGALLGATLSTVSIYRRLLVDQETDEAEGREEER